MSEARKPDDHEDLEEMRVSEVLEDPILNEVEGFRPPRLVHPRAGTKARQLVKKSEQKRRDPANLTPEQKLLLLDTWVRSGLPAKDFASLVGISHISLYSWKKRFHEHGPAGLMNQPKGVQKGSRLPEVTKRSILMMKEQNPEWGTQRISDMLVRGPGLPASATSVAKVLHENGYELKETPTKPHPDKPRRFERSKANQMWQTDLFTFILRRQNRRVHLVAFMDDNSRFIVSYGLYATGSASLVIETFRSGVASYGTPEEVLTDNGSQYITWRGKSAFAKEMDKRGIKHVVASPRRPQTLGKVERFWGTLWRECVETAVFLDLEDARKRIGLFIDYYNFQRPHQGINAVVPADRFFGAADEVLKTLKERVKSNALELARHGIAKKPFYVTGQVGGKNFSLHAEGERMIMKKEGEGSEEVELSKPTESEELPESLSGQGIPDKAWESYQGEEEKAFPGESVLVDGLKKISESFEEPEVSDDE